MPIAQALILKLEVLYHDGRPGNSVHLASRNVALVCLTRFVQSISSLTTVAALAMVLELGLCSGPFTHHCTN